MPKHPENLKINQKTKAIAKKSSPERNKLAFNPWAKPKSISQQLLKNWSSFRKNRLKKKAELSRSGSNKPRYFKKGYEKKYPPIRRNSPLCTEKFLLNTISKSIATRDYFFKDSKKLRLDILNNNNRFLNKLSNNFFFGQDNKFHNLSRYFKNRVIRKKIFIARYVGKKLDDLRSLLKRMIKREIYIPALAHSVAKKNIKLYRIYKNKLIKNELSIKSIRNKITKYKRQQFRFYYRPIYPNPPRLYPGSPTRNGPRSKAKFIRRRRYKRFLSFQEKRYREKIKGFYAKGVSAFTGLSLNAYDLKTNTFNKLSRKFPRRYHSIAFLIRKRPRWWDKQDRRFRTIVFRRNRLLRSLSRKNKNLKKQEGVRVFVRPQPISWYTKEKNLKKRYAYHLLCNTIGIDTQFFGNATTAQKALYLKLQKKFWGFKDNTSLYTKKISKRSLNRNPVLKKKYFFLRDQQASRKRELLFSMHRKIQKFVYPLLNFSPNIGRLSSPKPRWITVAPAMLKNYCPTDETFKFPKTKKAWLKSILKSFKLRKKGKIKKKVARRYKKRRNKRYKKRIRFKFDSKIYKLKTFYRLIKKRNRIQKKVFYRPKKKRYSIVIKNSRSNFFITLINHLTGHSRKVWSSGLLRLKTARERRSFQAYEKLMGLIYQFVKSRRIRRLSSVQFNILRWQLRSKIGMRHIRFFRKIIIKAARVRVSRFVVRIRRPHGLLLRGPKLRRK